MALLKQCSGGILTGGQASRMQHQDKGLVQLHGQPLVAYVADTLTPLVNTPLYLSANRHLERYAAYGQVVTDPSYLGSYQGPLAGVVALLEATPTDWLLLLAVDSPFISAEIVLALWQAQQQQPNKLLFYAQHQRSYPLCLLAHQSNAAPLKQYLLAGHRRVHGWLAQQQAVAVDMRSYAPELFWNINTPADIQHAQAWSSNG